MGLMRRTAHHCADSRRIGLGALEMQTRWLYQDIERATALASELEHQQVVLGLRLLASGVTR